MRRARTRTKKEPTIALINIVFLMLIFFMVAGTLAKPLDKDLRLVSTAELEGRPPPDGLVLHPDGRMSHHGKDVASAASYLEGQPDDARDVVRLVLDRDLHAQTLVARANELRAAGAKQVLVVTERALK